MRRLLALAALLVALAPAPGVAAADAAGTDPAATTPRACADALALLDDSRPRDAVALVDAYRATASSPADPAARATACADVRDAAVAARDTAATLAAEAEALEPGGARPTSGEAESWAAARARAEQALALDAQDARAAAVVRAAQEEETTVPDRAASAWDGFVEAVSPLGPPLLALLVGVLVLAVVARLVVPVTLRWPVLSAGERVRAGAAGWGALVAGAALLVWGPAAGASTWTGSGVAGATLAVVVLVLGFVAGVVAVALALGRLVAPGAGPDRTRWWAWATAVAGVAAVAAVVLSARALGGPGTVAAGPVAAGSLVAGAVLAALGVLLVATVLATRLRLTIEVTSGRSGDRTTSHEGTGGARLVALLGELGAEPPRGLEVPRGTDISALSGSALSELPQGAFVKAVVSLAQGVVGSVPWRVTVEERDADHLAVVVTRNGRAAGSAALDRAGLLRFDPEDPASAAAAAQVDLYRAAAAVVLLTLARHHAGFEGLCGATSWRSLALQYVAQSDLTDAPDRERELLARAVDVDPRNDLAQVALAHAEGRHHTLREDLDAYGRWLDRFVTRSEGRSGYRSLRLRAQYSRAATTVNACFAPGRDGDDPAGGLDATAVDAVRALLEALAVERAAGREDALVVRLQDAVESLYLQAEVAARALEPVAPQRVPTAPGTEPGERAEPSETAETPRERLRRAYRAALARDPEGADAPSPTTPTGEYNLACTYAVRTTPLGAADALRTTDHLRRAVVLADLRAWLHDDPMLAAYRERPEYAAEFGQDPLDLLAVAPFARYSPALRAWGLTTEQRIVAVPPPDLAALLGTTPEEAARVRAAAHLAADLPALPGRCDVLDVLLAHDVGALPQEGLPDDVARAVRSRVVRLRLTPSERYRLRAALAGWLG
ncbi:Uncharacterized membrane protein YdcZ, DUF606 family [Cellulosimicrobium aquatile]|uniref:Uncharacterized membrane protein YdcZ, DUF606 family n=1 Tax=Cellulosimicrobium aquatile TaxID=1612203 RepID=A0A1N6V9F2_9MICO|nr:hypothetical protein [Cellulosimicrobium aquatile]SIQ74465.1 Uncharacterized membrane protein YdcZ, DUF606 family [Cellulosimicrobium aquatile]